jgi:1-acyl-sn-glycerol-3-phosphate acyltransferase
MGWRIEGNLPDEPRLVIAVAPHTSNWDFVVGFSAYLALQLDATWFGKHTLFRWPLGPILRYFGGIPIVRTKAANVVDLYIHEFARRERMVLAIAPEGTRKKVAGWKTGFYHIAHGAGVPIVPVSLDFSTRRVRILAPMRPTGELERDLAALRANFRAAMAKHPENYAE